MKRICLFLAAACVCTGAGYAAVRDTAAVVRGSGGATQNVSARTATNETPRAVSSRAASASQSATRGTTTRNASVVTARATTARSGTAQKTNASRAASTVRSGVHGTSALSARAANISRAAGLRTARAGGLLSASASNTFGADYNECHDAYFTCMDQFCATANDTYRRCVCSSRLDDVKARQNALSQTDSQLKDFKDLNIEAIPKTAAEVNAMLHASEGEYAASIAKDKSAAAMQLAGISEVLAGSKTKSLSTAGTLDIAGDINQIWAITDLAGGTNIANLTGEPLYNAVHAQCATLVAEQCPSTATFKMVVSAYGMYIENDCSLLLNTLDKQATAANASIRQTEREMDLARLENYNAHNSASINECIAKVRQDITADTACGDNYVHCLDVTGLYLNKTTGEVIYTENLYQLDGQVSLSGDVLTNTTNRMLVAELNRKKAFAEKTLDTCRDLSGEIWDEFMRQAITEIYQGQQSRLRAAKDECLEIVNECYDEQTAALKDFSNIKDQLLLGSRLELSEELCRERLNSCTNLYGGMDLLLTQMHNITDQKIAKDCRNTLMEYLMEICAVPGSDTIHSYPYGCRAYAPGDAASARLAQCNIISGGSTGELLGAILSQGGTLSSEYMCYKQISYTKCNEGYYQVMCKVDSNGYYTDCELETAHQPGDSAGANSVWLYRCLSCDDVNKLEGVSCRGGILSVSEPLQYNGCGERYHGSLYQKVVRYAQSACVRPANSSNVLPTIVLEDVNAVMDSVRSAMGAALARECERLGGVWVSASARSLGDEWNAKSKTWANARGEEIGYFQPFYNETGADKEWGYCRSVPDSETLYTSFDDSYSSNDDNTSNPETE